MLDRTIWTIPDSDSPSPDKWVTRSKEIGLSVSFARRFVSCSQTCLVAMIWSSRCEVMSRCHWLSIRAFFPGHPGACIWHGHENRKSRQRRNPGEKTSEYSRQTSDSPHQALPGRPQPADGGALSILADLFTVRDRRTSNTRRHSRIVAYVAPDSSMPSIGGNGIRSCPSPE